MADPRESPAMQQYSRAKKRFPGCLLLFRIGDFYECFDDDAVTISKAIGLTLTRRTEGLPMAGVPFHQLEVYLKRLVQQGFRVAVADQMEEASKAKGLVQRDVTRVITPGTLVDDALLEDDASNTVAAVCFTHEGDDSPAAVAIVEASTGDFAVATTTAGGLVDELARRRVREVIYAATADGTPPPRMAKVFASLAMPGTPRPAWHFRMDEAREALTDHFRVRTLAGFGLRDDEPVIAAAGALVRYLRETQAPCESTGPQAPKATLDHLRPPRRDDASRTCIIDAVSLRALEVERVLRTAGQAGPDRSLVGTLLSGKTCRTSMGKRMLREWLCRPLADLTAIAARQAVVGLLVEDRRTAAELAGVLEQVQDVARIAGRIALDRATPRDVVALGRSLARARDLVASTGGAPALGEIHARLEAVEPGLTALAERILRVCVEEPPPHLRQGGLVRDGIDAELDEARLLQKDAGQWLSTYQERLIAAHGLPSLKVGFNKIFGYYIELPAAQARVAPPELQRTQTLKNAERYTTPELREFEQKVTTAEGRAFERERVLFAELCGGARAELAAIAGFGETVATLDALLGLAELAHAKGWRRPELVAEPVLAIHNGRHPVLEEILGTEFVPNDCTLGGVGGAGGQGGSLALITGPNMAGKSTYIRTVALIALLAHVGSFVPADRAVIGRTDRIFTRIGADDALHAGQSTFMVEMTETANILNHATASSLVVLDEIGRGTSTLDGLSLAWAIAEFLAGDAGGSHARDGVKGAGGPRTLFATHYHELTELEERLPGRVRNLHVAVREWKTPDGHSEIVFLHRILPGRTDQSYGIHVARLAGLPGGVVSRAREVLASLNVQHGPVTARVAEARAAEPTDGQLMLFTQYVPHPAVDRLKEMKLEAVSPLEAFDALRELKALVQESTGQEARPTSD